MLLEAPDKFPSVAQSIDYFGYANIDQPKLIPNLSPRPNPTQPAEPTLGLTLNHATSQDISAPSHQNFKKIETETLRTFKDTSQS